MKKIPVVWTSCTGKLSRGTPGKRCQVLWEKSNEVGMPAMAREIG